MFKRPKISLRAALTLLITGTLLIIFLLYRPALITARPMLPVAFDHADHLHTGCIDCHHNWNDGTGNGACYSCHKHTPDIAQDIEQMFHDFCRDCHVEVQQRGEKSGPVRRCGECHRSV